jgi:dCMP deaminase
MRPSKSQYYIDIATAVAKRGTCLRRIYGAVIVKNDQIISTGYCGAPRRTHNCIDRGVCKRQELNISSGERYDLCRSVHAEQNAIIHASRMDLKDSDLYLSGIEVATMNLIVPVPCVMCKRMIINAGIDRVITMIGANKFQYTNVSDWLTEKDL